MSWTDDLNACAAIVEKGDPVRFRTVMAAPVQARAKLFPLYAFNVEIARAPWVTAEPMIAEMRLQWWRDALEEISAGDRVRRHEVVTPLAQVLRSQDVMILDEICEARRWDCYKDPFDDAAHLTKYLQRTSGNLMQMAVQVLGGAPNAVAGTGLGLGVANWLRALPALEAQRRIPLLDGTPEGVRALARQGLDALAQSKTRHVTRAARPALWPAIGAIQTLNAAIRDPSRVGQGTLPEPPRLALSLRAALGL